MHPSAKTLLGDQVASRPSFVSRVGRWIGCCFAFVLIATLQSKLFNARAPAAEDSIHYIGRHVVRGAVVAIGNLSRSAPPSTALSSSSMTVCESHTGGTCFFTECPAEQNAMCMRSWSTFQWHSCDCKEGKCAGADGRCHSTRFEATLESWFRTEHWSIFFMIVVFIGRSGVDGYVGGLTGLDRLTAAHHKIKTKSMLDGHKLRSSFEEMMEEQELNWFQAVTICITKLVFWHIGQIVFFLSAWFAYRKMMGWFQFICATVVALKEVFYGVLLFLGVKDAPQFLLYVPLSAQHGRLLYCLSPASFVGALAGVSKNNKVLVFVVLMVEFAGALCACMALAIGLLCQGIMFPSLCCGYVLSAMAPVGVLHTGLFEWDNF